LEAAEVEEILEAAVAVISAVAVEETLEAAAVEAAAAISKRMTKSEG